MNCLVKNFCKLFVKKIATKSGKIKRHTWINKYDWLFKIFGIEICNFSEISHKKCFILTLHILMIFIWGISFYVSIRYIYASIQNSLGSLKQALTSTHLMVCAFLIWYYIFQSRLKLNKSVIKLQKMADILKVASCPRFERICLSYFTITYMLCLYLQIQLTNTTQSRKFIQETLFGSLDIQSIDWRIAMGVSFYILLCKIILFM